MSSLTNLLLHQSMHSCNERKWVLVSTSRVSRMVRVCLVTVRSSTIGNDKEARGVRTLECNKDRKFTHL